MGKDIPLEKIKNWIECFERFELEQLTIEEGKTRVRIQRTFQRKETKKKHSPASTVSIETVHDSEKKHGAEQLSKKVEEEKQYESILSPMTGIFYRSPAPGVEAFLREGQRVHANDTLCIIEAMKVMNEIKAEQTGILFRILVEDSKIVQKGEPLFLFEPS